MQSNYYQKYKNLSEEKKEKRQKKVWEIYQNLFEEEKEKKVSVSSRT